MKFERLNESNGKGKTIFLCGLITGVGLLIIFNLFLTKAKYKVVDSAKLVNSTISYSNADFSLIAIYIQEGTEENPLDSYKKVDNGLIPTNKELNEELTYCKVGEEELKGKASYNNRGINITVSNNTIDFTGIKQAGTKCYLYFDLKQKENSEITKDKLHLAVNTTGEGCPVLNNDGSANIVSVSTEENGLLCEGADDYGTTYYFRGVLDNNWVKIGDYYWRIIRINGNGTIRLIYVGKSTSSTGLIKSGVKFNTSANDNKYVGFMYGSSSNDYKSATENKNLSNVLTELKTWWTGSDFPEAYKKYVDGETGFCNDRTPYGDSSSGSPMDKENRGYGTISPTYYGSRIRIETNKKSIFKCMQENDLFTIAGSEKGNKALPVPVGLITADEVIFAGGLMPSSPKYWLSNGSYYWTMSPSIYLDGSLYYSEEYIVTGSSGGTLYAMTVTNTILDRTDIGIRPVINLKADTPFTSDGDGTTEHPFTVKLD